MYHFIIQQAYSLRGKILRAPAYIMLAPVPWIKAKPMAVPRLMWEEGIQAGVWLQEAIVDWGHNCHQSTKQAFQEVSYQLLIAFDLRNP